MFFLGYRTSTARPQELPYANLNEKKPPIGSRARRLKPISAEPARRRTAAQSMTTKRKTGTVAKSQSGSKRVHPRGCFWSLPTKLRMRA